MENIIGERKNKKKELEKRIAELQKTKKVNLNSQLKMNSTIFKSNFEVISNLIIGSVWKQIYEGNNTHGSFSTAGSSQTFNKPARNNNVQQQMDDSDII